MSDTHAVDDDGQMLVLGPSGPPPWTIDIDRSGSITFVLRDREPEERHVLTGKQICEAMRTLARMALVEPQTEKAGG